MLKDAVIRLIEYPVDAVSLLLGNYWTPHIDSFIGQAHVDDCGPARDRSLLGMLRHGEQHALLTSATTAHRQIRTSPTGGDKTQPSARTVGGRWVLPRRGVLGSAVGAPAYSRGDISR
ncbi:hypothetical protein GCM10023339_46680 [Alloalcanivorax gelatiniphagus]